MERRDPALDSHDRGTWHLDCSKAAGACNNACFSVICLQQDTKKMYYDSGDNNGANRKNSGCDVGGSVCNVMPFSQKLNDPQGLTKPSCDEWPMAELKNDNNKAPNVLRCIDQAENSSGGTQLKNFINGVGHQPDRKGQGHFVDGDYWEVDFQNADPTGSPYCLAQPGQCTNDGFQFYFSGVSKNLVGIVSPEYDYDRNNHYALSAPGEKSDIDIVQCKVHLTRSIHGSSGGRAGSSIYIQYKAEVFDYKGNSKGKRSAKMPSKDNPLSVDGVNPEVKIWAGKKFMSLDDVPNYQADNVNWTNDKEGYGGLYCRVGEVDGNDGTRDEDCWFPCFIT
ncbi:MAG: hypothetical protein Q9181_002814 [Wetmoreana brouardii]